MRVLLKNNPDNFIETYNGTLKDTDKTYPKFEQK